MKTKIALIGFGALAIIFGGQRFWFNFQPPTSNQAVTTETSELKTYNNSKYGFSFSYPKDYKLLGLFFRELPYTQEDSQMNSLNAGLPGISPQIIIDIHEFSATATDSQLYLNQRKSIENGSITASLTDSLVNKIIGSAVVYAEVSHQSATLYYNLIAYNAVGDRISIESMASDLNHSSTDKLTAQVVENDPIWQEFVKIASTFKLENTLSTTGWKTYANTKYRYSVEYPSNYTVYKYTPPCGSSLDNINGQNVIMWINSFLKDSIEYETSEYHNDLKENKIIDFDITINDPDDKCVRGHYTSEAAGPTFKLINSEIVKVGEYEVLKRNYEDVLPSGYYTPENGVAFKFSTWRFENNGTYYTLLYNNGVTSDPEVQKDVFMKFLNSFKFTAKSDEIQNWKTYTDTKYGFSFQYPNDWYQDANSTYPLEFSNYQNASELERVNTPSDLKIIFVCPDIITTDKTSCNGQSAKSFQKGNSRVTFQLGAGSEDLASILSKITGSFRFSN